MAYEKNIWTDGDIITAEKLNNMEDGIANGGSGATPDWNENDDTSPSYIANRPFYTEPWIHTYIFSTGNAITFTYNTDGELPNGGYYSGTYTVNTVDDTDYSNMKIGIELFDDNDNKIMSNYGMYYNDDEFYSDENDPNVVYVGRAISGSSTEYTINFFSENIGDTIDAFVYFGIVHENITPIDPKYLGTNGIVRVKLTNDGLTITLSGNNYFKSLDELANYLFSGSSRRGGYVYLEMNNNVYTMIDNSGTNIGSYTFVFKGNDGVIEYNRSTQEFTFYPLTAYINKNGNTYTCDTSWNKLKYVEYIVYHETGTKMFADKSNTDITCQGVYCEMAGNTPTLMGMNFLINSSQVIANINEYSLTEVTT